MNPSLAQFKKYFSMPKKVVLEGNLSKMGKALTKDKKDKSKA